METQTIEYKQTWRDDFLKEICGFANAQGGPRNVQEHLKYLQKGGILCRVGPDKGGHWEIVERKG